MDKHMGNNTLTIVDNEIYGEGIYTLDSSGHRVVMPNEINEYFDNDIAMVRSINPCLVLLRYSEFNDALEYMATNSMLTRYYLASMCMPNIVRTSNRTTPYIKLSIPKEHIDHLGIRSRGEELIYVGLGRTVEIWQLTRYRNYISKMVEKGFTYQYKPFNEISFVGRIAEDRFNFLQVQRARGTVIKTQEAESLGNKLQDEINQMELQLGGWYEYDEQRDERSQDVYSET